ncbi:MAG: VanZ family protein [Bacteroidales bacterium]
MNKNSNNQWILFCAIAMLWIAIIQIVPRFLPFNFDRVYFAGLCIHTDYFTHVMLFVTIVLVINILRVRLNPFLLFFALLFVAVIAEVVQLYIPKRTFNYWDLVSNIAGVIIGFVLVWMWRTLMSKS